MEYRFRTQINQTDHKYIDEPVFEGTITEIREQFNDYCDDLEESEG
jgi:hypothetical protein